ncbi:MAG: hypothetical protein HY871_02495 [Chloroflexi bacterium]|nr:hypothetical protein [Chloroflexota bacterium]
MKLRFVRLILLEALSLTLLLIAIGCNSQAPLTAGGEASPAVRPQNAATPTATRPAATPTASPVSPTPSAARTLTASPVLPAKAPAGDLKRTDNQGAVTVVVTPLNLGMPGKTLDFKVVMDTHSVELAYDLTKSAILRDNLGREYAPLSWDGGSGGHHLSGRLSLPATDTVGQPVLAPDVKVLELILKGIGGVPSRVFRWDL